MQIRKDLLVVGYIVITFILGNGLKDLLNLRNSPTHIIHTTISTNQGPIFKQQI